MQQSAIKATSAKGKKDKKKAKKGGLDLADAEDAIPEGEGEVTAAKNPVEMTAEELADEEWGPSKEKGKKAKKGKAKKGKAQADSGDEEMPGV